MSFLISAFDHLKKRTMLPGEPAPFHPNIWVKHEKSNNGAQSMSAFVVWPCYDSYVGSWQTPSSRFCIYNLRVS